VVTKTFKTTVVRDGSMCFIPITFDSKAVFGKVRAPVKVTLNGYTYRSTIAAMGGPPCIPLRRSNREAAGLEGNETLEVRLELDTDARTAHRGSGSGDPRQAGEKALAAVRPASGAGPVAGQPRDVLAQGRMMGSARRGAPRPAPPASRSPPCLTQQCRS
jgi:Domain of unknown function (DUF1905)